MCDRCYNPLKFQEFFKYKTTSDFDFCETCYVAITNDPKELDSYLSRDEARSDLKDFIIACKVTGTVLGSVL